MKKLLFSTLLLSLLTQLTWAQNQPVLLITDIDDTIKITDMPHKARALRNVLFSTKAFTGMSELYQEIAANSTLAGGPEKAFYVLSAGPILWLPRIKELLEVNEFPAYQKIQTRNFLREKTFDYKYRVLSEMSKTEPQPFILIGDDTESDADVFTKVKKENPSMVTAVYIRQTINKDLPAGATPFYSALDVAVAEMAAGRLNETQVTRVANSILDEENNDLILPYYASCPKKFDTATPKSGLETLILEVSQKIKAICQKREPVKAISVNETEG